MSARKLGRLAGLVFVLAAILGGLGAQHAVGSEQAVQFTNQTIDWH
jgi:hypothetical protein